MSQQDGSGREYRARHIRPVPSGRLRTAAAGSGADRGTANRGVPSKVTRNELVLLALRTGDRSTAELARTTGLSERVCRYGLRHLIVVGYAWSPARGRWRLTDAGRVIASTLPSLLAAGQPDAESIALPEGGGGTATAEEPARLASGDPSGTPTSVWWTLAGIIVAIAVAVARRSGPVPPPLPPPAPPTAWPYDGWRI